MVIKRINQAAFDREKLINGLRVCEKADLINI